MTLTSSFITPLLFVCKGENRCSIAQLHCVKRGTAILLAWAWFMKRGTGMVVPDFILCLPRLGVAGREEYRHLSPGSPSEKKHEHRGTWLCSSSLGTVLPMRKSPVATPLFSAGSIALHLERSVWPFSEAILASQSFLASHSPLTTVSMLMQLGGGVTEVSDTRTGCVVPFLLVSFLLTTVPTAFFLAPCRSSPSNEK